MSQRSLEELTDDSLGAISGGGNEGQPLAKVVTDNKYGWYNPARWFGYGQTKRCSVSFDGSTWNDTQRSDPTHKRHA